MSEPGPMSLTATLVMAGVVLALAVAWLVVVFLAARQPAAPGEGPGRDGESRVP